MKGVTPENALEKSIEHWEANLRAKTADDIKLGTDHCALCFIYHRDLECLGCPVQRRSGQVYCEGTPYESVYRAAWAFEENPTSENWDSYLAAAQAELDFLKSLRTPNDT